MILQLCDLDAPSDSIVEFMSQEVSTENGTSRWPLPELRYLIIDRCLLSPLALLRTIRRRYGLPDELRYEGAEDALDEEESQSERSHVAHEAMDRPAPLLSLVVSGSNALDFDDFDELEAIIGEGRVERQWDDHDSELEEFISKDWGEYY